MAKADYGRQGLGWDPQARIQLGWVNFWVFLTSRSQLTLDIVDQMWEQFGWDCGALQCSGVGTFWENRYFWKQLVTLMAKTELIQIG